jgi:hypothetical protein
VLWDQQLCVSTLLRFDYDPDEGTNFVASIDLLPMASYARVHLRGRVVNAPIVEAEIVGWKSGVKDRVEVKPPSDNAEWEIGLATNAEKPEPLRAIFAAPSSEYYAPPQTGDRVLLRLASGRVPVVVGVAQAQDAGLEGDTAPDVTLRGDRLALWAGARNDKIEKAATSLLLDGPGKTASLRGTDLFLHDQVRVSESATSFSNCIEAPKSKCGGA